jgi:DNA replication protein DnaC
MADENNRERLRAGVGRARRAAAQGLSDVRGAVVQGATEVSKRADRSAAKRGHKKSASATEKAPADPAVSVDGEQQKAMQDLGTANISGQTGVEDENNREWLRAGVGRARRAAAQGLNDVRGAVVQGATEVSKRADRSAAKRGHKKSASATEKAPADPAVFFDREQQKAMQDLGTANILISGQTGVGKSTLINAVLRVPVAEEGTGKPVTEHVRRYHKEGVPVTIFDTPGIELGQKNREVIREYKKTIASSRTGRPEDLIHVA